SPAAPPPHPPSLHDALPISAHTPAPIRRLLRRCLEKDRKRRLDSAADARLEIDEALAAIADASTVRMPIQEAVWRRALPWAATRSEEHTSELQSRENLVCRL